MARNIETRSIETRTPSGPCPKPRVVCPVTYAPCRLPRVVCPMPSAQGGQDKQSGQKKAGGLVSQAPSL